jgi:hypothetical protein
VVCGEDVGAVVRVLMRDDDRVDEVRIHGEGNEGAGAGIAPNPSALVLDDVPRTRIDR